MFRIQVHIDSKLWDVETSRILIEFSHSCRGRGPGVSAYIRGILVKSIQQASINELKGLEKDTLWALAFLVGPPWQRALGQDLCRELSRSIRQSIPKIHRAACSSRLPGFQQHSRPSHSSVPLKASQDRSFEVKISSAEYPALAALADWAAKTNCLSDGASSQLCCYTKLQTQAQA